MSVRVDASPFVWVPLAGVVGALFAMGLGLVAMRTRGHAFVIITIAFLLLTQLVLLNWPSFTKGSSGLSLPLAQWDPAYQNWPFYYSLAALLAVVRAAVVVDPALEARHGPRGHARGRGQGGDGRHQHADVQDARLRGQRGAARRWRAGSTPTT